MKSGQRVIVAMAVVAIVVVAIVGVGERRARAGFCPMWACGSNAATVGDGVVFDELNVFGETDDAGIRIRSVLLPDKTAGMLVVDGHHLSARNLLSGAPWTGSKLKGTIITVSHSDGRAYELLISNAVDGCERSSSEKDYSQSEKKPAAVRKDRDPDCLTFWATPHTEVPYYTFLVKKISQRRDPNPKPEGRACTDDRLPDKDFKESICTGKDPEFKFWSQGVQESALVFEGDHYDPHTKDVQAGRKGWFNLACAGTAAAKMHLLRHTEAGSIRTGPPVDRRVTSLPERTSMLRMLTADYCGNGSTFTINGQPLLYGDIHKWYPPPQMTPGGAVRSAEAAWGPGGLLCLTDPRRYCKAAVESICSTELGRPWTIADCPKTGVPPAGTHVLSANPKLPPPAACINHP